MTTFRHVFDKPQRLAIRNSKGECIGEVILYAVSKNEDGSYNMEYIPNCYAEAVDERS